METQKNQVAERLKQATNILVTVSANPSVDQLAGAIGLTLLLNKLNKHAAAVFSGAPPSTIEFLQPDKTLEKNTDSLRDFIIALDKSKADKLRYKVEDQMVKIFITPYMTSINEKDLEFSQGDFNVEVVVALGVNEQQDLDQAITSNGRILHDATVISIGTKAGGSLGSINWVDEAASSMCEMLVSLGLAIKEDVLDAQTATALLTGIVAETNRFSNEKTSSETMQISAKLMAAGANQQLVASQLQPPAPADTQEDLQLPEIKEEAEQLPEEPQTPEPVTAATETAPAETAVDGTLDINHGETEESEPMPEKTEEPTEASASLPLEPPVDQIHIDEEGMLKPADQITPSEEAAETPKSNNRLILEPPSQGSALLTANDKPEGLDPSRDALGNNNTTGPILSHDSPSASEDNNGSMPLPPLPTDPPLPSVAAPSDTESHSQTLAELESLVTSGRVEDKSSEGAQALPESAVNPSESSVDAARDAVSQAMAGGPPQTLPPVQALNAQPMDLNLGDMPAVTTSLASAFASNSSAPSLDFSSPAPASSAPSLVPLNPAASVTGSAGNAPGPDDPPPVPPPLMPPTEQGMSFGQQPLPNAEDDNKEEEPLAPL